MTSRREREDQDLFHGIVEHYLLKDMEPASRIARKSMLLRAVEPELLRLGDLGTVVEVGCGVGASATYLAGGFRNYIGIDYAPAMIDVAKDFAAQIPNTQFITANIKHTGLPDAVADTILMVGALHHMTELDAVMAELLRISKPGARLVAIEPQRGNPLIQLARWIRAKVDPRYSADQHFFSRHELGDILSSHGVSDLDLRYFSYFAQPFAQVVLKPDAIFAPLSRMACFLDPLIERLLPGELGRLAWLLVASGTIRRMETS